MTIKISKAIRSYSINDSKAGSAAPAAGPLALSDRRLELQTKSSNGNTLYLERRPRYPQGNASRTYMIESPNLRSRFGIVIGETGGDQPEVFEMWVVGEAPRGMNAIAKSLSADMRSKDWKYLQAKLESLAKTAGDPFDMEMPDGNVARIPSEVAAVAKLVHWRCNELGIFDREGSTQLVDAMLFKREPKTDPNGSMAWNVDVQNPNTGDDFVIYVKEGMVHGSNKPRPFSVWLSGAYPKSLDGLAKSLSRDLWIEPLDWFKKKLSQLEDIAEPMGDFRAVDPKTGHHRTYPSTVAYIAALLNHRLIQLGYGDDNNGNGEMPALRLVEGGKNQTVGTVAENLHGAPKGELCSNCQTYNMVRSGGCSVCTNCSHSTCG